MQQTGGLTKRRKRNLTKVTGLGTIPYDEGLDTYNGSNLFHSIIEDEIPSSASSSLRKLSQEYSSITISALLPGSVNQNKNQQTRRGSKIRVTRDPLFSQGPTDNIEDEENANTLKTLTIPKFQNAPQEHFGPKGTFPISGMTINFLRLIIMTASASWFLPWSWNHKTKRIDAWKSPTLRKIQRIFLMAFSVQTVCILFFQLKLVKNNFIMFPDSHRGTFMHMFIALWYVMNLLNTSNSLLNGENSRLYVNALLDLNEKYTKRFVVDQTQFKEEKRMLFAFVVPEFWYHIPSLVYQFAMHPTLFFYLTSYIYNPETDGWYWTIPGIIHEFLLTSQTTSGDILTLWILFFHATSCDFWLTEAHKNNDTGQTTEELRDTKTAIEVYKTILVLTKSFNDCMASLGIAICKTLGCIGSILCCYCLIRTTSQDFYNDPAQTGQFILGTPSCFSIAIICLNLSAKIYDLGVSFLDSWGKTKQKDLRRIIMGCPTLHVKMGHFYTITVSTTITFFQVVIGYLIDCIITFK